MGRPDTGPRLELKLSLSASGAAATPPEGVVELIVWGGVPLRAVVAGHGQAYEVAKKLADQFDLVGSPTLEIPYRWVSQ